MTTPQTQADLEEEVKRLREELGLPAGSRRPRPQPVDRQPRREIVEQEAQRLRQEIVQEEAASLRREIDTDLLREGIRSGQITSLTPEQEAQLIAQIEQETAPPAGLDVTPREGGGGGQFLSDIFSTVSAPFEAAIEPIARTFESVPIPGSAFATGAGAEAVPITQPPPISPARERIDVPTSFEESVESFRDRPLEEQLVYGLAFDPLNVLPGVGFAPSPSALRGVAGAAPQPSVVRQAGEALTPSTLPSPVRAPAPSPRAGIFGQAPPPSFVTGQAPPSGTQGEAILQNLGANLRLNQQNADLAQQFLSESITPAFLERFGDAPVMSIQRQFPEGGEPLLRISSAGWRERAQSLGLEFVGERGFDDLYRIPQMSVAPPPSVADEAAELAADVAREPQIAKREFIEQAAPDGRGTSVFQTPDVPDGQPSSLLERVRASNIPGERLDQTALRLHEAALNSAERQTTEIVRLGNERLRGQNLGIRIGRSRAARPEDMPQLDELHRALHNPSRVASGEIQVPANLREMYDDLRGLMDWESASRIDFNPNMATVDDYFYRGWKPPEHLTPTAGRGRLVNRPSFMEQRNALSYDEMRELGFEPLFWNPYDQWRYTRMQGVRYRQQMELVDVLKNLGDEIAQPHVSGPIPEGWRIPKVGPAFEGKPFAYVNDAGIPEVGHSRAWIVPDRVANTLENIYGRSLGNGKVIIGGRTIDLGKAIDTATFVPKRAKLFGSFFQQVDFLTRGGVGSWHGMVNALFTGHPVQAVRHLALYPRTAADVLGAYFVPSWRRSLVRQLDSTKPLVKGRPGVTMKSISDSGLSISDVTILPANIDAIAREVAEEAGTLRRVKSVPRAINNLELAMRQGLFQGVYPAAIINDVQNNIAPIIDRIYPHLTDEQMSSVIARLANIRYSSLPASQSAIQNRTIREALRRIFFSINESEGLLRQATGTIHGGQKRFWIENWLGAYLFMISVANLIHFISTGQALPRERYAPVTSDPKKVYGPLPVGYNPSFAAPTVMRGKGDIEVMLDVVGQLDTAFRVLDPPNFIASRQSVPIRAFETQRQAQDFYGNPINEVGPEGVVSRTTQLAQDLFAPIGIGQAGINILSEEVPESQLLISGGEQKLGTTGQLIQGTGLNLRAATIDDELQLRHPNYESFSEEKKKELRDALIREVFGPRTRLQEERYQERIWELWRPTEQEMKKFEDKMNRKYGPRFIPRRRMIEPRR